MIEVPPGRVIVYSDVGCPWAHVAVFRLHKWRADLGLQDEVTFELRSFPLELFNERPTPRNVLDAEMPVAGALEPDAGWQVWARPDYEYPVTMLPALEAVHAASEQSAVAGEQLDRALRVAFFGQSRCVSMRHVIREVASNCDAVDSGALIAVLDDGRYRRRLMEDLQLAKSSDVQGSPHVFAPGLDAHNPGIQMHWEGEHGSGFPVVDKDDPSIYEELLAHAAGRH